VADHFLHSLDLEHDVQIRLVCQLVSFTRSNSRPLSSAIDEFLIASDAISAIPLIHVCACRPTFFPHLEPRSIASS
jgi:hypothetical protein